MPGPDTNRVDVVPSFDLLELKARVRWVLAKQLPRSPSRPPNVIRREA